MSKFLLAIVFVLLLFGPVGAQTPMWDSPTLRIAVDVPDDLSPWVDRLEVMVTDEADPTGPVLRGVTFPREAWDQAYIREHIGDLPDGEYYIFCRFVSRCDVEGPWSEAVHAIKDWTVPPAPGGCALLR